MIVCGIIITLTMACLIGNKHIDEQMQLDSDTLLTQLQTRKPLRVAA